MIEKSSKFNSAKALIYGKAGIGKTTLCKYIAYRWAKGELYSEFENIVYIALREWKDDGLESIIKKIYFEEKHKDEAIEIDQSKTLFLFDGYDELSDTSLLHGAIKKYNLQNYIITSRPYGYRKSDFDVNEVFETIGFADENVIAYIDKFFQEQSHKTNLQNFLKQNINIKHIAYIPLMLEMICSLWREKTKSNQSFLSPMTMTELYSEVIEYIFFEYSETNNTAYVQDREDEIFDYLGKIAFEGLKRQIIVLDKSSIKEKKEFFVEYVLKTGFLKSDRKHRNPLMNSYQFPHLTFQEYFSALYVSKLSKEEISEVIRDYKFYPYMQVFFAFLGGLIEDKEWLLQEIESQPRDLVGAYEIVLILNCLHEIKIEEVSSKRNEEINIKISNLIQRVILMMDFNDYQTFRSLFDKFINISHWLNKYTIMTILDILKMTKVSIPIREMIAEDYLLLSQSDTYVQSLCNLIIDEKIEVSLQSKIITTLFSFERHDITFKCIIVDLLDDLREIYPYAKIDVDTEQEVIDMFKGLFVNEKMDMTDGFRVFVKNERSKHPVYRIALLLNNITFKLKLKKIKWSNIYEDLTIKNFDYQSNTFYKEFKILKEFKGFYTQEKEMVLERNKRTEEDKSSRGNSKEIIESVFLRLDNFSIDMKDIIASAVFYTVPIYIKDNKLYSFSQGKEIKTINNINQEKIEQIDIICSKFKFEVDKVKLYENLFQKLSTNTLLVEEDQELVQKLISLVARREKYKK